MATRLNQREANILAAGIIGGITVGGALGYIFTKAQLEYKYDKLANERIAVMRDHYEAKRIALDAQIKQPLDEMIAKLGYKDDAPEIEEQITEEENLQNVFEKTESLSPDWQAELASRDTDRPYLISLDEFMAEGNQNTHAGYTYYAVDGVLVDENDEPVVSDLVIDRLVGLDNIKKLGTGLGTDDPNTILVRNEALSMDIEVANHSASYEQEHLGGELEHADDYRRRHRRQRFDDE